jgi:hypothetical protein
MPPKKPLTTPKPAAQAAAKAAPKAVAVRSRLSELDWKHDRLTTGSRTVGTTMVSQALQIKGGVYFDSVERPYLRDYELVLRNDPYLHRIVNFIVLSMTASLGNYTHPNPERQAFIQDMEKTMNGSFDQMISELIYPALWAGFAGSEKVFETRGDGLLRLKDMISYHPASLYAVPGRDGKLTDGKNDPSHPFLPKTGIWQQLSSTWLLNPRYQKYTPDSMAGTGGFLNYVRIPLQKMVWLAHNQRHGNFMGESLLTPIWQRYEMVLETWKNLMITTERYGSPQVLFIVPRASTNQLLPDPGDGSPPGYKSLAQVTAESAATLSASQGMVIEEPVNLPNKETVRAQNISSFNNFGQNFLDIIDHLYRDIFIGMGVPPLLFMEHGQGLSAGAISKVHAETYKQFVTALYKEFVRPFTEQVIGQLLYLNFGETDPGAFAFNPFDLASAETIMNTFEKAIKCGILDPEEHEDLQLLRTMLGLPTASLESLKRRQKAIKELMEIVRRPDADKVAIAKIRSKSTEFHAETAADAQVEAAEVTAGVTLQTAQLQANTADKGRAHDMTKHEMALDNKLETTQVQAKANKEAKVAIAKNAPPVVPGKPTTPKPAAKKAA